MVRLVELLSPVQTTSVARVIWIAGHPDPVSPVELSKLQGMNDPRTPLGSLPEVEARRALARIAAELAAMEAPDIIRASDWWPKPACLLHRPV